MKPDLDPARTADLFHPAVAAWFRGRFPAPSAVQAAAWPAIRGGQHTLIAAPTGAGKTLAAFLAAIDDLVWQGLEGALADQTQVVYVSPLRALSNDIERNLQEPLAGIRRELAERGLPPVVIRTVVRTGDTPASARTKMLSCPPHIVVTTPESLYILLTTERGRRLLRTTRTVIVDEIHALVGNKRGSHLALSLERLAALCERPPVRIGLSATQRPIEAVARFLVGAGNSGEPPRAGGDDGREAPPCTIIDIGHRRDLDLTIEVPESPLEAVMSGEVWEEIYDRLAALVRTHRTTLIFVNTRRLAERVTRWVAERVGSEHVAAHHGSLSREQRMDAERRLKEGRLRALVATSSLELGIDIGSVDLVCQLGSTRLISTLLQRVGRSGHALDALPKGRLFPLSLDELAECAALVAAVRAGELDRLTIPEQPLDILAQQIVASVAAENWDESALFDLVRRAWPYRNLGRADFDVVVRMLADGFASPHGRRGALLHRDAVHHELRARRGARLAAITCGGAIPDTAEYSVLLEPTGTFLGTVTEDFAVESYIGDIFQLGNASWRVVRVEPGKMRVADARGETPTLPFWLGEAPARSAELSAAVSQLRAGALARFDPAAPASSVEVVQRWLVDGVGITAPGALQLAEHFVTSAAALGTLPSQETLVVERFFDEAANMHLVIHAPFGSRLNRAWGLALRKRFCRKFDFELQASATEDAIALSLGPTHSFPLEEIFDALSPASVRDLLTQAVLAAPVFTVRWRWNVTRALAVLRFHGGRKVPANLLRMHSDDLLAVVFPDQAACAENSSGDRDIPDHPLVRQTIRDCLEEAMDIARLEALFGRIQRGELQLVTRDLVEPSPLAQEILNARPYAFLDDAPLEERRTRAVLARRWIDPEAAGDLGALDAAAIERVRRDAWPEAQSADELQEALVLLGFVTEDEGRAAWQMDFAALVAAGRATVLDAGDAPHGPAQRLWVAAERLPQLQAVFPAAALRPPLELPAELRAETWERDAALTEIVRSRLDGLGPVTAAALGAPLGLADREIEAALVRLESAGSVLRGRFTPGTAVTEWCERRLLARIHRQTVERLRAEIEPVPAADFLRFLLDWQHVSPDEQRAGPASLGGVLQSLEGFAAPAAAWESEILPARVADYDPEWLDAQCGAGHIVWARLLPARASALGPLPGERAAAPDKRRASRYPRKQLPGSGRRGLQVADARKGARGAAPIRSTPIVLLRRRHAPVWTAFAGDPEDSPVRLSPASRSVDEFLLRSGAAFFDDVVLGTRLLPSQVEAALAELVALGRVSADRFAGLRALLVPTSQRRPHGLARRRRRTMAYGIEDAGRWTRLSSVAGPAAADAIEIVARALLRRWGVVFRKLLEREGALPPWRDLLRTFRRMEARGEIRGGRFVAGFAGEQFALPEAVTALRGVRRLPAAGSFVSLSAADPLNLVGILTPGPRVAAVTGNRVLYRDGVPVAIREAGSVRFQTALDEAAGWQARKALVRRPSARAG